jgi:hypothetical protein
VKIAGPLAIPLHASANMDEGRDPASSDNPVDAATTVPAARRSDNMDKRRRRRQAGGREVRRQDCYHVTIHASAADLQALDR